MAKREPIVSITTFRARTRRGATVTISIRRRPVARVVPVRWSREQEMLDCLAARGVLQRDAGKPGKSRRVKARVGARRLSDLLIEDRG
jgi:antitoxin (DNA-binding transcriptional repressor) of toxin-antitoxin stability system